MIMRTTSESRKPAFCNEVILILKMYGNVLFRNNILSRYMKASILLYALQDMQIKDISLRVKLSRNRVSEWINKATLLAALLNQIAVERPDELEYYVVKMLDDKPKRGRNLQYSAETRAQIIKVACNAPKDYGITASHWSYTLLRTVLIDLNIINENTSISTIYRILNSFSLKPHKSQYWLHSADKDEDPINYRIKLFEISGLYITIPG